MPHPEGTHNPAPELGLRIAELPKTTRTRAEKLATFIRDEFRALKIPVGDATQDAAALKKLASDPSVSDERLEKLEEATGILARILQGKTPDVLSEDAVRDALSEMRAVAREEGMDAILRITVLSDVAVVEAKMNEDPTKTLNEALAIVRGLPSDTARSSGLSAIAVAWVEAGNLPAALALAPHEPDPVSSRDFLHDVAVVAAETGHLQAALEIAQSIVSDGWRCEALEGISMARSRMGDIEGARRVAELIPPAAVRNRDQADFHVARAIARNGDIPSALAMVRQLRDNGIRDEALASIAGASAHAGDIPAAREIVATIGDRMFQSFAAMDIAVAEARDGDFDAARETLRSVTGSWEPRTATTDVARIAVQSGSPGVAFDILQSLPDTMEPSGRSAITADIAIVLAESGDFDGALALARKTAHMRGRAKALAGIAAATKQHGGDPATLLQQALQIAHDLPGWHGASALRDVAKGMLHAGEVSRAVRMMREISDQHVQRDLLKDIVPYLLDQVSPERSGQTA